MFNTAEERAAFTMATSVAMMHALITSRGYHTAGAPSSDKLKELAKASVEGAIALMEEVEAVGK